VRRKSGQVKYAILKIDEFSDALCAVLHDSYNFNLSYISHREDCLRQKRMGQLYTGCLKLAGMQRRLTRLCNFQ
jgi:hypothetical protein